MAVGVAFGAASLGIPGVTLGAAISLAIGIGLQNFPEGLAVAIPLCRAGLSRIKSFWYGQLSALWNQL
jgi:zinc transporter, ZIP family